MRFIDEFREQSQTDGYLNAITRAVTRSWTIMEVCGGQTHTILQYGIEGLLPSDITLVHGPGCPVCVTATETIDAAIDLSQRPGVTLATYGDMLRVPDRSTICSPRDNAAAVSGSF
jgi:hydrogenase expression/formation protein HypD